MQVFLVSCILVNDLQVFRFKLYPFCVIFPGSTSFEEPSLFFYIRMIERQKETVSSDNKSSAKKCKTKILFLF